MRERCEVCGRPLETVNELYDHMCTGCLYGDHQGDEPYEELDFNDEEEYD